MALDIVSVAYSIVSVIIVSLISFVGIVAIAVKESVLRELLIYFVSMSAGALFGDVFIHLLPEAYRSGVALNVSAYVLIGILLSFVVEKVVQWRHCHVSEESLHISRSKSHSKEHHVHPFAYMNLWGDGVHNFIDGLVMAASYLVSIPLGIATTLAVVFHEIPQELGDFGVLLHGGFTKRKALFYNFLTALTAVVGAVVSLLIGGKVPGLIDFLVPFAAGEFIYIAGSDLIPELHKETKIKASIFQIISFVIGILIMWGLLLAEAG